MRALVCIFLTSCCFAANVATSVPPRALAFEARGDRYVSHGPGYSLTVSSRAAVLNTRGHAVSLSTLGANRSASIAPLDPMSGKANYMFGRDVRASYSLYARLQWHNVYPGIDVVFRGNQEHLEYDFDIAPRRDPGRVQLAFDGIDDLRVDQNGDLLLRSGELEIRQPKPFAYQIVAGKRAPVEVSYVVDASNHVRFQTGPFDRSRALVIDPEIVFDKTFGGSGTTIAGGFARDAQGNLYVTGSTSSTDFPIVNPVQNQPGSAPLVTTTNSGKSWTNLFLGAATSVNVMAGAPSAPSIVYAATNLGIDKSSDGGVTFAATPGTGLSGQVSALAVDAGSATTLYAGTPQGVFVSTDNASSWKASTNGISSGAVTVLVAHPTQAGTVFAGVQDPNTLFRSTDFGQTWTQLNIPAAIQQQFSITNLVVGSNGSLVATTGIGPLALSSDEGNTWTAGANLSAYSSQTLAMSPTDPKTVYLTFNSVVYKSTDGGQTFAALFTATTPQQYQLAIDPRNSSTIYMAAYNVVYQSTDAGQHWLSLPTPYPISPNAVFVSPANSALFLATSAQNNVFVTKWSPDGSQMLYSTYLGGSGNAGASGIAVDGSGSAYIVGYTNSPSFPATPGAYQFKPNAANATPGQLVFAAKLSPDGSQLMYAALLGYESFGAANVAVDGAGEAVITSSTSGNYPVTPNAFQTALVSTCAMSESPFSGYLAPAAAFLTKLSASGSSLIYSTLLGGSCATYSQKVAIDASGNAWVVGSTISPDFPVTSDALQPKFGGGQIDGDGFLARFSPSGSLDYATYIGGPKYDSLNAIAFDSSSNVYVTGQTSGLSQPASPGAYQPTANGGCFFINIGPSIYEAMGNAVVMKLDPKAHNVLSLTYLGAPGCLVPSAIAVDTTGEPWISGAISFAGNTLPTVGPVELGGSEFISKFSADFKQLLFSTDFDFVASLALDSSGFAYVGGTTSTYSAYVDKIDPTLSAISINSVAITGVPNPQVVLRIAPGQVIRILGAGIGPAASTPGIINSGVLATTVAGVQVTFDGVAVPLLSVSAQEIDLVVPFELATKSTTSIQVLYNGAKSNAIQLLVVPVSLQVLAVLNEDFTLNSASNPAKPGSVLEIYLAGVGNSNPPSQDGQVNAFPLAALPISLEFDWYAENANAPTVLPISFAGAAYGLAAGIYQVNFQAPPQTQNVSVTQIIAPNTYTGGAGFMVYVQQ